jgi:hypothetical protein
MMTNDLPEDSDARWPLLRSIQREVVERCNALQAAEDMLSALAPVQRHYRDEISLLRSEVSLQRRELRHVATELRLLGIDLNAEYARTEPGSESTS